MGKAHSLGFRDVSAIADPAVPRPRLVSIYGRDAAKLEEARDRYGWERATTDWRELVEDPEVELVDNAGPNHLHVEPTLAAIAAGKHVFCEKPLGPTAAESHQLWSAADKAGVRHMCAFNYRFLPALQLARQMIASGELGQIFHFRSQFLVSSSLHDVRKKGWRDDKTMAGAGALGDLGSHHIDLSRFLLGSEPRRVSGTHASRSPRVRVERSRRTTCLPPSLNMTAAQSESWKPPGVAGGHLVTSRVEVDGSRGSLQFSMQSLNELRIAGPDRAFKTVHVLDKVHPYASNWFPPGHPLGWVDSFSHEACHVLGAIGGLHDVAPIGATFKDGYHCAEVVDAICDHPSRGMRQMSSTGVSRDDERAWARADRSCWIGADRMTIRIAILGAGRIAAVHAWSLRKNSRCRSSRSWRTLILLRRGAWPPITAQRFG